MSKGGNTKNLVKHIPLGEKPCGDYESLRDACFNDFVDGESYETQAYVDCNGHLTVGVGTLLYHKRDGEKVENVNGQQKSRFGLCGYNATQRDALIKATKALKPSDYDNINLREVKRETVTRPYNGKNYKIVIERLPKAGTRIISVQEDNKQKVNIPKVSRRQYKEIFNVSFRDYYNRSKRIIGEETLHSMPKSLQCLCVHQVYANWSFPAGVKFNTLENACQACADSITARGSVSKGEKDQLKYCQKVVKQIRYNERHKIVIDSRPVSLDQFKEWAKNNQIKLDAGIQRHEEVPVSTRVAKRTVPDYRLYQNRNRGGGR